MVGALVLLLGNMASALEFTNRRFLAIETVKTLTNAEVYDLLRATSQATPLPNRTIPIPSVNKTVVITDPIRDVIMSALPRHTTPVYLSFMSWRNAHSTTFAGFQYAGGPDGVCWQRAGTVLSSVETNSWQAAEFSSGKPDYYKAYVTIRTSSGPYTWYSGESSYKDHDGKVVPFVNQCFNADKFTFYDYFTAGNVYTDLPLYMTPSPSEVGGGAVRASLQSYYENEQTPSYAPFQFVGYSDAQLDSACSFAACPSTGNPSDPGPGGPPAPACTRPDGSTSGNPYDCAPKDEDTKCAFIDIPCNLKYLFIPRKDFLTEKLKDGVGLTVKFPITITNEWKADIKFAGHTFKAGASFDMLNWSEETKDQFRFYAWWSTFLFLLSYLGVPFMAGKRGMADAAQDSTVGAAAREQAANDKAKADYDRLRADDSWKSP